MSEISRPYIKCALLTLIFILTAAAASAIQPSFIKGTITSAYNNSLIPGTSITATTGVSTYAGGGTFSLRVPPDIYKIIFSAPGYQSNFMTGLHAAPGQTRTLAIQLSPASTQTGYIKGKITDKNDGDPVQGAYVLSSLGGFSITDENGRFLMPTPSGANILTVCADKFETAQTAEVQIPPVVFTETDITLSPERDDEITIAGSVIDQCTGGLVIDADILSSNGRVTALENGRFTISAPSGHTTLIATADGYQFTYTSTKTLPLSTANTVNLVMTPNKNNFGLARGVITDSITDTPVSEAKLVSDTGQVSTTDSSGTYRLYGPVCASTITISRTGYSSAVLPVSLLYGISVSLNISLDPQAILTGTVRDSLDGHGIIGARAEINSIPVLSGSTGNSGTYRIQNIPPDSYDLTISHECYQPETIPVSVSIGETRQSDFSLIPNATGTLTGHIYDRFSGDPIAGAVILTDHGSVTTSDAAGFYTMALPAECSTSVSYKADGYIGTTSYAVDIQDGGTTQLDIHLTHCPILLSLGLKSTSTSALAMRDFFRHNRNRVLSGTGDFKKHISAYYRNAFEISSILKNNPELRQMASDILTALYRLKSTHPENTAAGSPDRLLISARDFIRRLIDKTSSSTCKSDLNALLSDLKNPAKINSLIQTVH